GCNLRNRLLTSTSTAWTAIGNNAPKNRQPLKSNNVALYFARCKPSQTAKMPTTRLNPLYKSKVPYCCCRNSVRFSAAKAENVVKPPQNPVINNSLACGFA